MKLQVLMSTMNTSKENIINLIRQNHLECDVLVLNQCGRNDHYEVHNKEHIIEVVEVDERGLSKSRNRALFHSLADICLIADDDMHYEVDLKENIIKTFEAHPDVDIFAFYIERSASFNEKELGKQKQIHKFSSLGLMSVQIAFRRLSIMNKNLCFDEDFGAGSGHFISGEENIFLIDCLRKGLKIVYVPIKIGATIENDSSWFTGYDKQYFESKGATFERLFPYMSWLMIYVFAVLKRKEYQHDTRYKNALIHMKKGRKECKTMLKGRKK